MTIIDSAHRISASQLKAAGVTAVGRYIGWDGTPGYQNTGKNIIKAEADELIAAGIDIFLVFEYNANAPAHGAAQGRADGLLAKSQMEGLGAPANVCCYFAVDFDIPDYAPGDPEDPAHDLAKLGPVGQYFAAIKALTFPFPVGVYGGYWACKRLFNVGLVHYGWQTVAWSGGNVDSRVSLLQETTLGPLPGTDVNIRENQSRMPTFGQWTKTPATPPPPPATGPTLAEAKAALAQVGQAAKTGEAAMVTLKEASDSAAKAMGVITQYLDAQK